MSRDTAPSRDITWHNVSIVHQHPALLSESCNHKYINPNSLGPHITVTVWKCCGGVAALMAPINNRHANHQTGITPARPRQPTLPHLSSYGVYYYNFAGHGEDRGHRQENGSSELCGGVMLILFIQLVLVRPQHLLITAWHLLGSSSCKSANTATTHHQGHWPWPASFLRFSLDSLNTKHK